LLFGRAVVAAGRVSVHLEQRADGEQRLRGCLVPGEPDDRFSVGYQLLLRIVDDLLVEGETA
jgi:hypothetical protein